MPYSQKQWQDRIKDAQGNIIQEGTPFSAGNMNRMEQGIADAHAQLEEAARAKQTLMHGVSVLNGTVDAPVNIEIEGRTLIPMQNTVLDPLKYYVLADKRTKLKWADATIQAGIAKFTVKAERPTLIRVANFEGKTTGSTLENPHFYKGRQNAVLGNPTVGADFVERAQSEIDKIKSLDGSVNNNPLSITSGNIPQQLFSFDLIAEIERQLGRIPRTTVTDKVQWIKDNVKEVRINWHGYGNSVVGNKATLAIWRVDTSAWDYSQNHTSASVAKIGYGSTAMNTRVDANAFIHFLAYAEPSDGVTSSTINTDYVELEIELKPEVILHAPRVPLYEVTKEHYDAILVTMLEDEVLRRYPSVEGVTHLQNPYIMAEGENLLPPFSEWNVHANATIKGAYDIELNPTSTGQANVSPVIMFSSFGQKVTLTGELSGTANLNRYDKNGNYLRTTSITTLPTTVTLADDTYGVAINFNNALTIGKCTLKNPMLTLGDVAKPFTPRNPSYALFETKLGSVGGVADRLYEQDAKYFKRKSIEDVVLDGSIPWVFESSKTGYKVFRANALLNVPTVSYYQLVATSKYNGKMLPNLPATTDFTDGDQLHVSTSPSSGSVKISISNQDSGLSESRTPTNDEVKAYFNGWKVKTTDPTTFIGTAWTSIFDGTDAPTQTLDYVKANKAPGYTPYKLSYVLPTPKVEEIKSEGAISVNGLTQIEVGSGIIVREKVTPSTTASYAHINNVGVVGATDNPLSKRAAKILNIYANGQKDTQKWTPFSTYANGAQRMHLEIANYDATAIYTVTYLVFDRQPFTANPVNVSAQFANNIRTALEDTTKKVEDVKTETSVNSLILYDVLKRLKAGGL